MTAPLAIDLFCGLGGWAEGLLDEGWRVVGFDIERHDYGDSVYPGQLVLQDVRTLHGSQFAGADLIVASPPCQAYSYRAMPWRRAKALPPPDNTLFEACFRIQREACEAAGRHVPMLVENVCGAQRWVGRAKWHYGSFFLWGDVPALMPPTLVRRMKFGSSAAERLWRDRPVPRLNDGESSMLRRGERGIPHCPTGHWTNPAENGVKQPGIAGRRTNGRGDGWFERGAARCGSRSNARKAASARIAKIPLPLAQHIGRVFHPGVAA